MFLLLQICVLFTLIQYIQSEVTWNSPTDGHVERVLENHTIGQKIVSLNATSTGVTVVYSIESEVDTFGIQSTTELYLKAELDYEETQSYTVQLSAIDGSTNEEANITIIIVVSDVNDNPPVFTSPTSVTIGDDTSTGSLVYTSAASDADTVSNLAFSIMSGNDDQDYIINATTGEITLSTTLNIANKDKYDLTLEVTDGVFTEEMDVTIHLTDVVWRSPSSISLPEKTTEDSSIMILDASNALLYFLTSGGDNFRIRQSSGSSELYLAQSLDRETTQSYIVTIKAFSARSKTADITINIEVTDVNDVPPVFSPASVTIDLSKDTDIGTIVYTAQVTDQDIIGTHTFSITDGNTGSTFSINDSTGELSLTNQLDPAETYTIVIQATDGVFNATFSLGITVNEVVWVDPAKGTTDDVPENTIQVVTNLTATTATVYTIQSVIPDQNNFAITDGQLTITSELDYENTTAYIFILKAIDSNGKSATVTYNVNVTDQNDIAPVFQSNESFSLPENAEVGSVLSTASATDGDTVGNVMYSITGGNADDTFTINSTSGELSLNRTLSPSTVADLTYSLVIEVDDTVHQVTQNVLASVKTIPALVLPENGSSISESVDTSGPLVVLNLTSTDLDEDSDPVFSIANQSHPGAFYINDDSTKLLTMIDLNFEVTSEYNVTLRVEDTSQFKLSSEGTLHVYLINENDEKPVFTSNTTLDLADDTATGTVIYSAAADDPDNPDPVTITFSVTAGDSNGDFNMNANGSLTLNNALNASAKLTYSLEIQVNDTVNVETLTLFVNLVTEPQIDIPDPNITLDEGIYMSHPVWTLSSTDIDNNANATYQIVEQNVPGKFALSADNAELITGMFGTFDYESETSYTITLSVTDSSSLQRSSTANVNVYINNNNDEPPEFTSPSELEVREVQDIGVPFYAASTTDPDSPSAEVAFSIIDGNSDGLFSIDSDSGNLTLAMTFDVNTSLTHYLIIQANDTMNAQTLNLTVNIKTAPVLTPLNISISEYGAYVIWNLTSTDIDGDAPSYTIVYQSEDIFYINDTVSAVVTNSTSLDYESTTQYIFVMMVTDSSSFQLSSSVTFTVSIINENDEPPIFQSTTQVQLHEDTEAGTVVYTAEATDADNMGMIMFTIIGGNDDNIFQINEYTGNITLIGNLNYSVTLTHTLILQANDSVNVDTLNVTFNLITQCGPPSNITGAELTYSTENSTATYACLTGYTNNFNGSSVLTCNSSGHWMGFTPTCLRDCGPPPNTTDAELTFTSTTENSTATYTCLTYYTDILNASSVLICNASGYWIGFAPMCLRDCGPPPVIAAADLTYISTTENSTATYECVTGYTVILNASSVLTCNSSGSWMGFTLTCLRECGEPPKPTSTQVTYNATTENATAVYYCVNGTTKTFGDDELTCNTDGNWTGTVIICSQECGPPPNIQAAVVTSNSTTEKSTASFECLTDYTDIKNNGSVLTCDSSGNWIGAVPVCVRECGEPPVQTSTQVTYNTTTENATAVYECVHGTTKTFGDDELTCNTDGNWTGTVIICLKDCGPPETVPGGTVSPSSGTSENSVATYVCNNGYVHTSGNRIRTCGPDGNWNGTTPICTRDCGPPETITGGTVSTSNGTFENSEATYVCNNGYIHTSENSSRTCGPDGNWNGTTPNCTRDCGPPETVPGGTVSTSSGTLENSVATYACYNGYTHTSGNPRRTCGPDGNWNGTTPICTRDCGPPETVPDGTVLTSSGTLENSVATYVCNNGYIHTSGNPRRTCGHDGNWNGTTPICTRDCGPLATVPGGTVSTSSGTLENSVATYVCNNGYIHTSGNPRRTCGPDGNWNGTTPGCTRDCGPPETVPGGTVSTSSGTLENSVATYVCNNGYIHASGNSRRTCGPDGNWNGTTPSCTRDCGPPETVPGGTVSISSGTSANSVATYFCNYGYVHTSGSLRRTCGPGGYWDGTTTSCTRDCGYPPYVVGAQTSYTSTTESSKAVYMCKFGYTKTDGEDELECRSNGIWTGNAPNCLRGFLAYGQQEGDYSMTGTDDRCNVVMNLNYRITFMGQRFKIIYICPNGLVCFNRRYESYTPPKNNVFRWELQNVYCLAPYFADINLNYNGVVWYQAYDYICGGDGVSQEVFDTTRDLVKKIYKTEFEPTFVLKATWDEAPRYGGYYNERVSFQVIYTTNGAHAYTFYNYGEMNFLSRSQFIGLLVNGFPKGFDDSVDGSFLRRPDVNVVLESYKGVASFDLTVGDETLDDDVICKIWHKKEKPWSSFYRRTLNWMPLCPCRSSFLSWDRQFGWFSFDWASSTFTVSLRPRSGSRYGKTCAYRMWSWWSWRWSSNFIRSGSQRGSFQSYNRWWYPNENYRNDQYYKKVCCERSNLCHLYYDVRPPVQSCYFRFPFFFGGGFGDPHITTLDGRTFTFNGLGEYTLLNISSDRFEIQSRTERAVTSNGSLSDATIFSGFAIQSTDAWLQVEINNNKTGINLFVGLNTSAWADYTADFYDNGDNFSYVSDGVSLSRDNNTLVTSFSESGVAFNVTVGVGLLQMSIGMPDTYQNMTLGLLGNFNGNKSDDFIPRSASLSLPDNATEREIFREFGKTWMASSANSIFKYDNGKSHADYSFPEFVPKFLDEANQTLVEEAKRFCGEDKNQCIFDYVFTGNQELAATTIATEELAAANEDEASNGVPQLEVTNGTVSVDESDYLYISVDEPTTFTLLGTDDGTLTYGFANNSAEASLSPGIDNRTVDVTLTVNDSYPVSLSVIATDDRGVDSPPVDVVIVLCTGCNSHGTCNNSVIREDDRSTDTFKYATCVCEPYWTGADCEDDFDGCEVDPCSVGRNCSDTPADVHAQNDSLSPYICTPCPAGYFDDGNKCDDIDECPTTANCSQNCSNNEGSYYCDCNSGYRLADDGSTCNDINECEESTSGCTQVCTNLDGSFNCSCYDGYTFNATNSLCARNEMGPAGCDVINCSGADGCRLNETGSAVCFCNSGYQIQVDNSCADIDECTTGVCSQSCSNTNGSYTCSCFTGYWLLSDKISCEPCQFPYFGENCASICQCGRGSIGCDPVHGCKCGAAWTGAICDTDVNECLQNSSVCGDINKVCTNTVGSYKCTCRSGYSLSNGTCVDVDECADPALNTCEQVCTDTDGGFTCSCNMGYNLNSTDASQCIDYDECQAGVSDCEHICVNVVGRYNCECYFGFLVNADRKSCTKVSDPCTLFPDVHCSDICLVVNQTAQCSCKTGFVLGADQQTCIDVNECDTDLNLNQCSEQDTCVNENGGYRCSCSPGNKLENDIRTCTECDSFHFGINCANECNCGVGATKCDAVTGCVCETGWTGNKCDTDKDECANFPCTGQNKICLNTPGSYTCTCEAGYTNYTAVCQDIDECLNATLRDCSQICTNTIGSYQCSCNPGFTQEGNACKDINECEGQNECSQSCRNTIGSYSCFCNDGFRLDISTRRTCIPDEQCDSSNPCGDNTQCTIVNSNTTCFCEAGYEFISGSVTTCEDILECNQTPSPCSQECTELQGGYVCSCNLPGYRLDTDQSTCVVCTENTYGDNCTQNCTCEIDNTVSCNTVDGSCTCKEGWEGLTCIDDINECDDDQCPTNSTCVNTDGSFNCKCDVGFLKSADGQCIVCQQGTFGEDCIETCTCTASNTESCNTFNGTCTCKEGWETNNCSLNIDECTRNSYDCPDNSICKDTEGSYECDCDVGFKLSNDGICRACGETYFGKDCATPCSCYAVNTDVCDHVTGNCTCKEGWKGLSCSENIDECTLNTTICPDNSTCVDKPGYFTCECDSGLRKTSNETCEDKDECVDDSHNCDINATCTNTAGSFTCDCNDGFGGNGTSCADVDECTDTSHNCDKNATCKNTDGGFICACNIGYSGNGTTCTDIDECTDSSQYCDDNAMCTNTQGSFTCACNTGFNGNGSICTDDDECANDNHTCGVNAACTNIPGSYNCTCNSGYSGNGTSCTDVDECTDTSHNCDTNATCTNTLGSFTCACISGFNGNGTKCSDDDECANGTHTCGVNATCTNIPGSYNCTCESGYSGNGTSCTDFDECTDGSNNCDTNATCTNTDGSFTCACNSGYNGNGTACTDKDECIDDSHNCDVNATCTNTAGSFTCDCNDGFVGNGISCAGFDECTSDTHIFYVNATCTNLLGSFSYEFNSEYRDNGTSCTDVKECTDISHNCDTNAKCTNTEGGFTCACNNGYSGTGTTCTDIDECTDSSQYCDDNATCTNSQGSFTCSCNSGFNGNGTTCTDDDECANGFHTCGVNAACTNIPGSYHCSCNTGYIDNGTSCTDVDECTDTSHNCDINATCTNTEGGFTCACNNGYSGTGTTCTDIDECTDSSQYCDDNATCTNTQGSFTCSCNSGFNGNGTTCTDDDECANGFHTCGVNAACTNIPGSYHCSCNTGYIDNGTSCTDVDECTDTSHNCDINATCTNIKGGFTCACNNGFSGNGATCTDDDECVNGTHTCGVNATCTNVPGSYNCSCNSGYRGNGTLCTDVDQCTDISHNCDTNATCTNIKGGFTCACNNGYSGNGTTCTDIDECTDSSQYCDDNATCTNTQGSFTCACNTGFNGNGTTCTDVDECTDGSHNCDTNATCTNTDGSFICACNSGYNGDGTACTECSDNTFGTNCDMRCNCTPNKTMNPLQSCDHVTGTCLCTPFWTGTQCAIDIDECVLETDNCTQVNEECQNIDGGFSCSCLVGYFRDNNGNCTKEVGFTLVHAVVTLAIDIQDNLSDTQTYNRYKREVKTQLIAIYTVRLPGVSFTIKIHSLRTGSLEINYDTVVPNSAVASVAVSNTEIAAGINAFDIFGTPAYASRMEIGNTTVPIGGEITDERLCKIYQASEGDCGVDYRCSVAHGEPICELKPEEDNLALVLSLAIGIPMFILSVAGIVLFIFFYHQRTRPNSRRVYRDDDEKNSSIFGRGMPVRVNTRYSAGPSYGSPDPQTYPDYLDVSSQPDIFFEQRVPHDNVPETERDSRFTWDFVLGFVRPGEKYHIKRPKVDLEPKE